jgi:hypothetical protein
MRSPSAHATFEVLRTLWCGEAGYEFFEIFNSTFDEPSAVERAAIDHPHLDGRNSRFAVEGVGSTQSRSAIR